jgi:uracil-DNA glycosylase
MHQSWVEILEPVNEKLEQILREIDKNPYLPDKEVIFRTLDIPKDLVRVIILGQDPYPTGAMAEGLAFSVPPTIASLPPSLRNILREYSSDLGFPQPIHGHLGPWLEQGVLLLNSILTVAPGKPLSHKGIGWEVITHRILTALVHTEIPIICWGNQALSSATKAGFQERWIIHSPHPSPLSAHRGFFGSKPFSRSNALLMGTKHGQINWKLD